MIYLTSSTTFMWLSDCTFLMIYQYYKLNLRDKLSMKRTLRSFTDKTTVGKKGKNNFDAKLTLQNTLQSYNIADIWQLLETNVFSNLVDLTLSFENYYPHHGEDGADTKKIERIKCIRNAPSLQRLEILQSVMTIPDLEEVHKNNLQLNQLVLISSVISVSNEYTLPTTIEPCHRLKTFILDKDSETWDKNCVFMDYIIAKYPNLICLEFLIRIVRDHYVEYARLLDDKFGGIDQTYPNHNKRDGYDPRKESINYFIDFYKTGGKRFLSNLPTNLQILKINTNVFKRPFDSLKESGITPTELAFYAYPNDSAIGKTRDIFADIIGSAQLVSYFQELPSLETLTCSLGFDLEAFNGKLISDNIRHLHIGEDFFDSKKKLHLDKVFMAFPSLETLRISDRRCSVTSAAISTTTTTTAADQIIYPHFQVLSMDGPYTTNAVDFIRGSLPNLRVLERVFSSEIHKYHLHPEELKPIMAGCVDIQWYSRLTKKSIKRYTIDLTGLKLDVFRLKTRFPWISGEFEAKLYLKIKTKDTIRAYTLVITPEGFRDIKEASQTVETYDIDVPNRITIHCDHIGRFNCLYRELIIPERRNKENVTRQVVERFRNKQLNGNQSQSSFTDTRMLKWRNTRKNIHIWKDSERTLHLLQNDAFEVLVTLNCIFLRYFIQKYTGLTHLEFLYIIPNEDRVNYFNLVDGWANNYHQSSSIVIEEFTHMYRQYALLTVPNLQLTEPTLYFFSNFGEPDFYAAFTTHEPKWFEYYPLLKSLTCGISIYTFPKNEFAIFENLRNKLGDLVVTFASLKVLNILPNEEAVITTMLSLDQIQIYSILQSDVEETKTPLILYAHLFPTSKNWMGLFLVTLVNKLRLAIYEMDWIYFQLDLFHLKTGFNIVEGHKIKTHVEIINRDKFRAFTLFLTLGGLVSDVEEFEKLYDVDPNIANGISVYCDRLGFVQN
ncbi:hypothetical protein K501DRAFT_334762 [Backusella circina FSU 941]|nr:hypothetical protein K501DRAFT_334762 [Backusella circina FSU 941]